MIAILLAGGYAKRLLPLTHKTAKPLLTVAGKPIIEYALNSLLDIIPKVEEVIVLVNSRFSSDFVRWSKSLSRRLEIISDGSSNENDKPGAIGALSLVVDKITGDFLVVAGDSIYEEGFQGLVDSYLGIRKPVVALYRASDRELVRRGAEVRVDRSMKVVKFTEKPTRPSTNLVAAAAYVFPLSVKDYLSSYIRKGLPRDEPGRFIQWLYRERPVYGYVMQKPVWDIGTVESYAQISRLFRPNRAL